MHAAVAVIANQAPSRRWAQLAVVDQTCWRLLHGQWKRDHDFGSLCLWGAQLLFDLDESLCAVQYARRVSSQVDLRVHPVQYARRVSSQVDLRVHPDYRPMEISTLRIECTSRCRVQLYFWEFPWLIEVERCAAIELARPLHSTYELGNVLCTIEADDADVVLRLTLRDNAWAVAQLWQRELVHGQLQRRFGKSKSLFAKREGEYWRRDRTYFPHCKRVI